MDLLITTTGVAVVEEELFKVLQMVLVTVALEAVVEEGLIVVHHLLVGLVEDLQ